MPSESPTWMAGFQTLGSSLCAFLGKLQGANSEAKHPVSQSSMGCQCPRQPPDLLCCNDSSDASYYTNTRHWGWYCGRSGKAVACSAGNMYGQQICFPAALVCFLLVAHVKDYKMAQVLGSLILMWQTGRSFWR